MAIAYVSKAFGEGDAVSSVTFAVDATGADIIVVGVARRANQTVNSVTYNGVGLTQIANTVKSNINCASEIWYLVAPASGSNNVVTTLAGSDRLFSGAICLSGVDQSSPVDISGGSTGTGTAISTSLTTTAEDCWGVDQAASSSEIGISMAAEASQTKRNNSATITFLGAADSTEGPDAVGSNTMSWTFVSNDTWAHSVVFFKPFVAPSAVHRNLLLLGVG
ncbi:MAG: hypothetical protein L0206_16930 [Actinobacteria bacterium]|nr:hypothetical protein [Actinomycetota bacterium]